jgi:hypothetical protein
MTTKKRFLIKSIFYRFFRAKFGLVHEPARRGILNWLDPKNGLAPGDPARMAARIIESVDVEPAPVLVSRPLPEVFQRRTGLRCSAIGSRLGAVPL